MSKTNRETKKRRRGGNGVDSPPPVEFYGDRRTRFQRVRDAKKR